MDGATAAVGDRDVYVGATPNLVYRLEKDSGRLRWLTTTGVDLFAYQPLTLANGVLYAINDTGVLVGIDAASGRAAAATTDRGDGGFTQCLGVGAGVAVARDTVYAPCDAGGLADLAGLPRRPAASSPTVSPERRTRPRVIVLGQPPSGAGRAWLGSPRSCS